MNNTIHAAGRITLAMTDTSWQPRRSHLEQARNELADAGKEIERLKAAFQTEHKAVDDIWKLVDPYATKDMDITVSTQDVVRMVGEMKADNDLRRELLTKIWQLNMPANKDQYMASVQRIAAAGLGDAATAHTETTS
jgi:hypothetical protein